ncbi:beta-galactosidase [Actinoplanes couchii]|uniref:beta-galactosidase n=1 Tax=Actinoplanes couchii TaxID=403638 RepID=A0ABQ3XNC9_9ACTN|nr:beta-galactosidase [Actinoplanes couchii]MDR6318070.1 beta-galactosidase [Actinoplanes couchii]GID60013.1 beta-galactosidase [Actinoplanes couchii]
MSNKYQRPDRVRFGAAYYHEYQPTERLKTDLDQMAEAKFSVIRVGESVWSTWEPRNGEFELDWLQPVLDGAHERGIGVILGTPTYAVPPWLARLYPEIAGEHATGQRNAWGARQEADYTHPAFRFHAERVSRRILERYASHPAVIGFQVDNEPGNVLLHNEGVCQRFVDWLRARYGDVQTLNREWGLVYWSHRLSDWSDLWRPDGNAQPQYDLAWRVFQNQQATEYIGWQADIAREYARPDQFVTTCIAFDRAAVDDRTLAGVLDVTSGNPYYDMQDALRLPDERARPQDWTTRGTWALYQSADRMFSARQEPFLVTETDAQAIGHSYVNRPAYDGQWRQVAWALISRGAEAIEYWHWHTLHFGTETYWGGVLPHSGRPGRVYREIARIGAELDRAGATVTGLTPGADVAFVYSTESKRALEFQPSLATGSGEPDLRTYTEINDAFYRGSFDAKLQSRVWHAAHLTARPAADVAREHPVLVAAALYITTDADLDWLLAYAEAGGHLILGPRTGYADHEARARNEQHPARLYEAAGVVYDEFSNIDEPITVTGYGHATRWIDGLVPTTAEVLASYEHPHFQQWAAVTTKEHGTGRITTVGTVPDPAFARELFAGTAGPWTPSIPELTVTSAVNRDGRQLRFVHNWSWDEQTFTVPVACSDVLADASFEAGEPIALGPWDVRVLVL